MLALHVAWSPGRGVCLWAEDPARIERPSSAPIVRSPRRSGTTISAWVTKPVVWSEPRNQRGSVCTSLTITTVPDSIASPTKPLPGAMRMPKPATPPTVWR